MTETLSPDAAMIEAQSAIGYAKMRSHFPADFFDNLTPAEIPEMLFRFYQCGFGDGIGFGVKRFAENTR
jgi:hypothetical protein